MEPETERLGSIIRETAKFIRRFLVPTFVICSLVIGNCAFAEAKAYDGVWFLGFNLNRPVTADRQVRQAIGRTVNRPEIVQIIGEEVVPGGVIPPGMTGYDPDLLPHKKNLKEAKRLMKEAGYTMVSPELKLAILLHTDGVKTIAIARQIQRDLKQIGIALELKQVAYDDEAVWAKLLAAGQFDLFLMGYKAGVNDLFDKESTPPGLADTEELLVPLFQTKGDANFTGYSSLKVDEPLAVISGMDVAMKKERTELFRQIDRQIYDDLPVLPLFYIERL